MMITHLSKRVIPFRPHDAKRVGEGCFYLDQIVWLNGDRIELGDRVSFNYGCFVNGFGGLVFEDGANIGPYSMLHTANHNMDDPDLPVVDQGWADSGPKRRLSICLVAATAARELRAKTRVQCSIRRSSSCGRTSSVAKPCV